MTCLRVAGTEETISYIHRPVLRSLARVDYLYLSLAETLTSRELRAVGSRQPLPPSRSAISRDSAVHTLVLRRRSG